MRFSKPFRIFIYLLITSVTLLVITSAVLSLLYEKAIVRYLKKYLDENLLTELSMKDIQFRVLKGFPNATVVISDVVLFSGKDFRSRDFNGRFSDTLLQAKSVSFQFDLLKLLNKQYELKKIEITQGRLNILLDKQNRHNFKIWKKTRQQAGKQYAVTLRSIQLNNTRVNIQSVHDQLLFAAFSRRTVFRGNYSANVLSGEIRGNLMLDSITVKDSRLIKDASLHITLKMISGENHFKVNQGRIHLNKAVATVTGEYVGGKERLLEITLGIPKFGLSELMSLLPADNLVVPENLVFTGNGKLTAFIRTTLSGKRNLYIRSGFELTGCTARNPNTRAEISQINARGSVSGTNAEDFELRLDQVTCEMGKGNISGNFYLTNLKSLKFRAQVHSLVDLDALVAFTGIDTLERLTGLIQSDFIASGSLRRTGNSLVTGLEILEKGNFRFDGVDVKPKNSPWDIRGIKGKAAWNTVLYTDSLSMQVNGNNLTISGSVRNLSDYLLKRGSLKSVVRISAENINLNSLFSMVSNKRSARPALEKVLFPDDIQLAAYIHAGNFVAGKFSATDVSLNLIAVKDSVFVNDFSLRFPDGSINGKALITANKNHDLSITCNSYPQKINIQHLFTAFNNFTQHFIVDRNVRGLLSGSVSFFARWDSSLRFIPKSLKSQAEITITNGELVQFEPMLKLSKYIDVEELKHIRFKTLENVIYINERLVTMPEMAIHSSAFNISISGQHSFDNVFDYRLKVLLSEVLFNKARKKKQELDEFLVEETKDDQTTIPLIIAGTPAKYDVHFDRKRAFSLTRSTDRDPGQALENRPAPDNFKIEWDEREFHDEPVNPGLKQNSSDFIITWDEEEDSLDHELQK